MTLTLLLMAGWVRSFGRLEMVHFVPRQAILGLASQDGCVRYFRYAYTSREKAVGSSALLAVSPLIRINIGWNTEKSTDSCETWTDENSKWHWHWGGFDHGTVTLDNSELSEKSQGTAPYWSIVLPMTFVSAWLLLSKARKPTKPALPTSLSDRIPLTA